MTHPGQSAKPVPPGWVAAAWIANLRRLAAACVQMHPARAADLRAWADQLEALERPAPPENVPVDWQRLADLHETPENSTRRPDLPMGTA